jgi:hypothetical protein
MSLTTWVPAFHIRLLPDVQEMPRLPGIFEKREAYSAGSQASTFAIRFTWAGQASSLAERYGHVNERHREALLNSFPKQTLEHLDLKCRAATHIDEISRDAHRSLQVCLEAVLVSRIQPIRHFAPSTTSMRP